MGSSETDKGEADPGRKVAAYWTQDLLGHKIR